MNYTHPFYIADVQRIASLPGLDEVLAGKTVLITGATGLLGLHLVHVLLERPDVRVIATTRSTVSGAVRFESCINHPRFTLVAHDVSTPFPEDLKADVIIPLASATHPRAYSEQPVETILTNVMGCRYALEMAKRCNATLIYPSSVEIYGEARNATDIFTEEYTGKLNLQTARACYPESKRTAEALCLSYAHEYGVDVRIARLSRIFGPTVLLTDSKASSQFLRCALEHRDIVLKSEGTQLFSYTYVSDAVSAMFHILMNGSPMAAYNVAAPNCRVMLRDFARHCAEWAGTKVVFDLPDETERRGYSVATRAIMASDRLQNLGWQPAYDIRSAIERTLTLMKS